MPRIALIYDSPGWAFHRVAIQVAKHCSKDLTPILIPSNEPRSWVKFHESIASEFDLFHYFWRGAVEPLIEHGVKDISTSVYDHQFLDNEKYTKGLLESVPFYVSSNKLHREYSSLFPNRVIPTHTDGVDTNYFYPKKPVNDDKKLRIGWVGKSNWGNTSNKGFHEVFLKSIEQAKRRGLPVEEVIADASQRQRTHAEMVDFYQEIDVLCCTSLTEGTPNPILEASASGRAWISTDVGIVPEIAGELQRGYIVDRTVDSFVEAFESLIANRLLVSDLGDENRSKAELDWNWERKGYEIGEYFRNTISPLRRN